jgi:hypothetical protein
MTNTCPTRGNCLEGTTDSPSCCDNGLVHTCRLNVSNNDYEWAITGASCTTACAYATDCVQGQTCYNGHCMDVATPVLCTSVLTCPGDNVCVNGVCMMRTCNTTTCPSPSTCSGNVCSYTAAPVAAASTNMYLYGAVAVALILMIMKKD